MKRDDLEFIKDRFEKTYPDTPESLSEDAISKLLQSKQAPKVIKLKPRRNIKIIINLAACLLLLIGISYGLYANNLLFGNRGKIKDPTAVTIHSSVSQNTENQIDPAAYGNVFAALDTIFGRSGWEPIDGEGAGGFVVPGGDLSEAVQQPDQIKCDGEYTYLLHCETADGEALNKIYIYKNNADDPQLVSVINYEAVANEDEYSGSLSAAMSDLYVYGDRLIVEIHIEDHDAARRHSRDFNKTVVQIYDISDKANPRLLSEFEQSGARLASQMMGNCLYTVSYYYAPKENGSYSIPQSGPLNKADPIPAEDISVFENARLSNYIVINAINVEKAEKVSDTKAVLGASNAVFFGEKSLYITRRRADDSILELIKADLQQEKIEFAGEAEIDGGFYYDIDITEINGLPVVLDHDNPNAADIFVLDEELRLIGKANAFDAYENISGAKVVGNILYVITRKGGSWEEYNYMLKLIDFSDPEAVKVSGTASLNSPVQQIIPISETRLLCVGNIDTDRPDAMVLLDVSDKSAPKQLDTKEFPKDMDLIISENYVVNNENGCLVYPCTKSNEETFDYGGVAVETAGGKIEIKNEFFNGNVEFPDRGRWVAAGDYLYCFVVYGDAPFVHKYN